MDGCSCNCLTGDWEENPWVEMCRRLCYSGQDTVCPACGGALVQGGFHNEETGRFSRLSTFHYHPECLNLIIAVADKHCASWVYGCEVGDECLDDWVARLDLTNKEDQRILEHASKVIERLNK